MDMTRSISSPPRRHGVSIVYVSVAMVVLLGFCSLAVDLGRVRAAKTELENAVFAATRAGAASAVNGISSVQSACYNLAHANRADGQPVTIDSINNVVFLNWPSTTPLVGSARASANAVQVNASYKVPLIFAQVLGMPTATVHATSTATVTTSTSTVYVPATADVWLSGEPNGTQAGTSNPGYDYAGPVGSSGPPSGNPYASPVLVGITVIPGSTITISNVSGLASYDPQHPASWTATGDSTHIYDDIASGGVSEHGISDATMNLCAMNAVFLTSSLPDGGTSPPALDFSTLGEQDYTSITPQLKQVFYVGTGQTSMQVQQTIIVPAGATRFYLGSMDGNQWYNDSGGFNATVTEIAITTVK
jgi:hypothetical protein